MRKLLRVGLWLAVAGGVALGAAWLPDALAELETFRAKEFQVVGARVLDEEHVLRTASIPSWVSVFDDMGPWEARLEADPLIREAHITRDLPATLVVHIEERVPVAFVATPLLVPVDRDGRVLPLDPGEHELDLPLLRAGGPDGSALSAPQVRILVREVERLTADDPSFMAAVSEITLDDKGDCTVIAWGGTRLLFRPPLSHRRLRDGLLALEDANRRRPELRTTVVDLRYEDQVVVSYEQRRGQ